MSIPFVGQRFDPSSFETYLSNLKLTGSFKPTFVTLHHTWNPNLANRPNGLTQNHLQNLRSFYESKGWRGGPHIFVDQRTDGIIVFQQLDRRGTHAVSFNRNSWGVELLGNFDSPTEFNSPNGQKIYQLGLTVVNLLYDKLEVSLQDRLSSVRFHREDPRTTKTCPGTQLTKTKFLTDLADSFNNLNEAPVYEILYNNRKFVDVEVTRAGRPIVPIRSFLDFLGVNVKLQLINNGTAVRLNDSINIEVVDFTPKGSAQVLVRSVTDFLNLNIKFRTSRILEIS